MSLDADYYRSNSEIQQTLAQELMVKYRFSKTDDVLDVGCGDGKVTAEIAMLVDQGSVCGIDASQAMIDFAEKQYSTVAHLSFQTLDAAVSQGFGFKKYDVVTSFNCLYWVKDIEQALLNIYRALKPGGCFLGLLFPDESEYWQPFKNVLQSERWQHYYDSSCCPFWKSGKQLLEICAELGFKDIGSCFETVTGVSDAVIDYQDYVKGWLPCLFKADSAAEYPKFLDDLGVEAKRLFGCGESLKMPYTKLHLYLQKS